MHTELFLYVFFFLQAKLLELGEIEVLLTMPISRFELYNFAITHNLEPEMRQTYL